MSEIDRDLARALRRAIGGVWHRVQTQRVRSTDDPNAQHVPMQVVDYTDPRSWGLMIEAIEALPGVGRVTLGVHGSRVAANAFRQDGGAYDCIGRESAQTYGEALARLLVQLTEER